MLKKIMLLSLLFSFGATANCPNISGNYSCINYEGKLYKQTVTINNVDGGIEYIFSTKDNKISWIVNGKQNSNFIDSNANNKIKMLYRGTCQKGVFINEFLLDDKFNTVRGISKLYLIKEGYAQENVITFTNDNTKKSKEECRKIN